MRLGKRRWQRSITRTVTDRWLWVSVTSRVVPSGQRRVAQVIAWGLNRSPEAVMPLASPNRSHEAISVWQFKARQRRMVFMR